MGDDLRGPSLCIPGIVAGLDDEEEAKRESEIIQERSEIDGRGKYLARRRLKVNTLVSGNELSLVRS